MKRKANVMVSAFIPKDHILGSRMNHDAQKAEYLWCNKALHLLYGGEKETDDSRRVEAAENKVSAGVL